MVTFGIVGVEVDLVVGMKKNSQKFLGPFSPVEMAHWEKSCNMSTCILMAITFDQHVMYLFMDG